MFYKQYPRNCTMINTGFERSLSDTANITVPKTITGCGDWRHDKCSGIFHTYWITRNSSLNYIPDFAYSFRGSIYVQ
jgi:hypothetical protein